VILVGAWIGLGVWRRLFTRLSATAPLLIAAAHFFAGAAVAQPLALLPMPASVAPASGKVTIGDGATIFAAPSDRGASIAARLLAERVRVERGLRLRPIARDPAAIRLVRDQAIAGAEAYRLTVTAAGVTIAARSDAGLVYGAMTLSQLLSPDAMFGKPVVLAGVTIDDAPRFVWRGFMIDVARHFQPIAEIRTIIDAMAALKLNTLHLHLTDDQGWRIEIKRYPALTQIGAWRTAPTANGSVGPRHGGFYTQDELRALVAYAQERAITIVPEIDLPGHAQAVVASYPDFGVLGDRPPVSGDWGVNPYLFNVDPPSMHFVEHVLDELIAIFPSTFIHLGGDEAVKDQWRLSPAVQAQMKALGIENETALQGWFVNRLGDYLAKAGRRLVGWDEILEGGLPRSAAVMSWRGDKGAIDAATRGHDVVLAPAPTLYFDNLQTFRADEPAGRLNLIGLKQVYGYEPVPAGLAAEKLRHVLGSEATLFAEYMVTPRQVHHATFPRLAAIAERNWSPRGQRDFGEFLARLDPQRLRFARAGIAAADTEFAVNFTLAGGAGQALRTGTARVALDTATGQGGIRYTLDGSMPTARSRAYAGQLVVPIGTRIRAAAFTRDGRATATPRSFDATRAALLTASASDLVACPKGALGLRVPVTPEATRWGPVFDVNLFDTCTVYPAAPLDQATRFAVEVQRLPRHYGLAHEFDKVREHYNVTRYGELVVRSGGCEGRVIGSFPLPDPAISADRMRFSGALGEQTESDLCLLFTAPIAGPFYAVEKVALAK
jgi:hexosaminidase